jgi:hypothetical protein
MRRRSSPTALVGLLCVLSILVGCAPRKTISSTPASFQLQSLKAGSVLFAPTIPESQAVNTPVTLTIDGGYSPPSVSVACTVKDDPFRLELKSDNPPSFQIVLPTPERWLSDLQYGSQASRGDIMETLYSFLADLDRLQLVGCFPSSSSPIRDYMLQSVPMRPSEGLFNAYGYLVGRGGLDLKAGLRVKIERAYFRPAAAGEEQHHVKNYLGVSTSNFDVERAGDGKLRFKQVGDIKYSPETFAQGDGEGSRDLGLRELPEQTHFRLLFYTYIVPKEQDISATIIGADSGAQLDGLEREIRAHATKGCETDAQAKSRNCFEFKGFVTVSAQINVQLNGKFQFVDWGTKVGSVLPKNALKSLRIQRQFMGSYYDVRFNPSNADVLLLALVGGDRLTWSKGSASLH